MKQIYLPQLGGFGVCHQGATLVDGDIGRCVVELKVGKEHSNLYGTLHGGFSATLVDAVTSYALVTDDIDRSDLVIL